MSASHEEFNARTTRLGRRHRALGRGYTASLRGDGLIVVHPRRVQFKLPVRGFVLLMIAFIAFKAFLLSYMGHGAYQERLDVLREGSAFTKAGAVIMGVDPVTNAMSDALNILMR